MVRCMIRSKGREKAKHTANHPGEMGLFLNPNYHQATDTVETLDLEFIRDTTEAVAGFLERHLTG